VKLVGPRANAKAIAWHSGDIGKQRRAERTIERQRTVVGTERAKSQRETWMMHLPQCRGDGI
jgi:hypothetical protein